MVAKFKAKRIVSKFNRKWKNFCMKQAHNRTCHNCKCDILVIFSLINLNSNILLGPGFQGNIFATHKDFYSKLKVFCSFTNETKNHFQGKLWTQNHSRIMSTKSKCSSTHRIRILCVRDLELQFVTGVGKKEVHIMCIIIKLSSA